jgi:AcrR family transcriptional regulator
MTGRRAARVAATRERIQERAMALFLERGYDATTVEQIAAAAGVSHMTFFRHFPTKEAVVDTDAYDPLVAALIRARPPAEDPVTAIHHALREGLARILPDGHDVLLTRARLIFATPQLRARQADQQHATRVLFATALAERAGLRAPTFALQAQAGAALGVMITALERWAADGGDLLALVDAAFSALRGTGR